MRSESRWPTSRAPFSLANSTNEPSGLPLNVERVCEWTWMCSMGDIHASNTGYGEIAEAFLAVLDD